MKETVAAGFSLRIPATGRNNKRMKETVAAGFSLRLPG